MTFSVAEAVAGASEALVVAVSAEGARREVGENPSRDRKGAVVLIRAATVRERATACDQKAKLARLLTRAARIGVSI